MKALLLIVSMFVVSIWNGYVLSVLWAWFIVPMFQAPVLRIPYAIGMALTVGLLTHKTQRPENEPDWPQLIVTAILLPAFVLLYGWIVKLFV